jgi:hypothetical protein
LQLTCRPDRSTLRGSVNPLLEAEDMPLYLLPWHVLPGHLQGLALCFGALPLTHRFTFQNTGSTSAYPGHYSRRLLLRASSAPAACGWHLLRKVRDLPEGCWGLFRSPFPLFEPLGRRYPPGFVTVPTGQSDGCQRLILCPLAPACQPLALVYNHDGSTTSLLSLPIGSC